MRPIDQIVEFAERRRFASASNKCASCLKPATHFRDDLSRKEYKISFLCQACQDLVFGLEEMEDEE